MNKTEIDMLVANKLIVKFKIVQDLNDSHVRQLLTYLEASIYKACPERCRKGWLFANFSRSHLQFKRSVFQKYFKKNKPDKSRPI